MFALLLCECRKCICFISSLYSVSFPVSCSSLEFQAGLEAALNFSNALKPRVVFDDQKKALPSLECGWIGTSKTLGSGLKVDGNCV